MKTLSDLQELLNSYHEFICWTEKYCNNGETRAMSADMLKLLMKQYEKDWIIKENKKWQTLTEVNM